MPRRGTPLLLLLVVTALAGPPAEESAAGDSGDAGAVRRLLQDGSPSARAAALRRLAGAETPSALAVLLDGLADEHPYVRRAAAGVLGGWIAPEARKRAADQILRAKADLVRLEACRAYALWADEEGWTRLRGALRDRSPPVRAEAARWLAEDPSAATTEALRPLLADPAPAVRAEVVDALAARKGERIPTTLRDDPDADVRFAALEGSAAEGGEAATVAVLHGLTDAVWSVRLLAAGLAGRVRDRRVLAPLAAALRDERARVVAAANASLVLLTRIPFDPDPERWEAWLRTDGKDFDPARVEAAAPGAPPPDPGGKTVAPVTFLDLPIVSRHVGFVIDASGSMAEPMPDRPDGASRWDVAKGELVRALERLTDAEVNVCCFADRAISAFPAAVRLTSVRRAETGHWLAARGPGGKTALYDGIAAALLDPALDQVVVLSDGVPSAGAFFTTTDLLSEVRRLNRRRLARIDVVLVGGDGGAARWRDAMERLAEESGGICLRRPGRRAR